MAEASHRIFRRTARATVWSSGSFVVVRIISMLRIMLLARLLAPEHFGQLSLVLIVIESLWAFSHFGFQSAVVQRRELDAPFLNTVWTLLCLRGLLLALLCWLSAPYVAVFFEVPELLALLHWAALVPAIQGLESMALALWQRDMAFDKRAAMEAGRELTVTAVSVLLAFSLLPDARAMVMGLIAGAFLYALLPYLMHSFRPKLQVSRAALTELWRFGSHLLVAGLLVFAIANLDNVVVGRLLDMKQLGFYSVAYTLAMLLTFQPLQLLQRVLFPAFAAVQDDTPKLHESVLLALKITVLALTFIVLGGIAFPDGIVQVIYGDGWVPVAMPLVILLAAGWFRGIAQLFGAMLLARGRTAQLHHIRWAEFLLFILPIVPLVLQFGIVGAALALVAAYIASMSLMAYAVARELRFRVTEYVAVIVSGALPAVAAFAGVMAVDLLFIGEWQPGIGKWGLLLFCYVGVFLFWLRFSHWQELQHLYQRARS